MMMSKSEVWDGAGESLLLPSTAGEWQGAKGLSVTFGALPNVERFVVCSATSLERGSPAVRGLVGDVAGTD